MLRYAKFLVMAGFLFLAVNAVSAQEWSDWENNKCYKGIDIRFKVDYFNKSMQKHKVIFQIRNRYKKRVWVKYYLSDYDDNKENWHGTEIPTGETGGTYFFIKNTESFRYYLRLKDLKTYEFWGCDNT